jgi:membrane protein
MDLLAPVRRFDRFQQSHKPAAIGFAVIRKFSNDQGGNLASLIAYYGFFSIFPLVFTTILGFVLQGDAHAQQQVTSSVLGQLPIIGDRIKAHALGGSITALVIGLITSTLAGLGVTNASQNALDKVWAVPFKDRPNFWQARLRGLGLLVFLGVLFLVSTGASGLVSGGFGGVGSVIIGYVVSLLVNALLFFAAFRFMTASSVSSRELRIGVVVASVLWTIVQAVGGYYIGHVLKKSSNTYGTFAFVIALLVWLRLGAQIMLYSAELNVVLKHKLWPRSLIGPPQVDADQRTLRAIAKVEERSEEQEVKVAFHTDPPAPAGSLANQPTEDDPSRPGAPQRSGRPSG